MEELLARNFKQLTVLLSLCPNLGKKLFSKKKVYFLKNTGRNEQMKLVFALVFFIVAQVAFGEKKVKVFVALCDNETQGIVKVGKEIGDGDKPESNLYWGCSDGLPKVFGKSSKWKKVEANAAEVKPEEQKEGDQKILRSAGFKHAKSASQLVANAYRGSEIKQCFIDFETAVASGEYDLVCFIGHNALMDFLAPNLPETKSGNKTDVIVLCCLSDRYCSERIKSIGARPILMTSSLMYPGSFVLHDVLEDWLAGKSIESFRTTAGKAYYTNQVKMNKNLSIKGATSVFTKL
jgi:hypothetical protein